MIEGDYVDAVIGLGKNLFYNSSMESCLLVCRMNKPKERKGKIIFINAVNEVRIERSSAWLEPQHIKKISDAYWKFKDVDGFAKVVSNKDVIAESNGNLSIQLYVKQTNSSQEHALQDLLLLVRSKQKEFNENLDTLFTQLKDLGISDSDFEKVKFEKIALNISERVEPKQTELEIYVGLEHLDCDDLVIRRRGKPADVIGTKLKIYKGDIIFCKRRAYLRKVAVADFDGIVSAHSMVLRAKEQNIEKDFLPYFLQSDEFMNRAVQISEGSLSPTIKWKALTQQEFVLPKKEKQAKLIDAFKQFDETKELVHKQKETLKSLKQNLLLLNIY